VTAEALTGHVLITGGAGSLGTAIIERAQRERWDAHITVYSRDEVKQSALRERFPGLTYRLGDIRDGATLARAMRGVDVVVHAAAYKRVPEAERESIPCAQANVEGSIAVIDAAVAAGVRQVVGISTDKACHPINAYGQSKALMERLFQSQALMGSSTSFHLVRYGNVLASRGSVVPTLQAQARAGENITLTDPEMTRFWLTLDDAVDLVLRSLALPPGHIYVPACRSTTMAELAEAVAPGVRVTRIGGRGGEKRHESLVNEHEAPYARHAFGGWALTSLALTPGNELDPFTYTSEYARRIPVPELAKAVEDIMAGRECRLL